MHISLKPEYEQFIRSQIETGNYASADEVINEAFQLLLEREHRLAELRQKVAVATEQIANGQVTDGEAVFVKLQAKIDRIADSDVWVATHFQMQPFKTLMIFVSTLLEVMQEQPAFFWQFAPEM